MRVPLVISSLLFWLVLNPNVYAGAGQPDKPPKHRKSAVAIRVEGDGWGVAAKDEIETVLKAVADELTARVPVKVAVPIAVTHTDRAPMVLYEKGGAGEYQVRLHAGDRRWGEYVYEFAHELCHIMSNYDAHGGLDSRKYNQWFEETLCETASLHTLRSLAVAWESAPPRPGWERHARDLGAFAELLINEGHRQLPEGVPLAAWLRENEETLRNDPYLREKNETVAKLLLPLFENDPEGVASLHYLNLDPADARTDLEQYLHCWYDRAPPRHKTFVAGILKLLGVEAPKPLRATASAPGGTGVQARREADGSAPAGQAGPIKP